MLGLDVLPDPRPARAGPDAGLPGRPVRDRQRHPGAAGARRPSAGSPATSRRHAVVLGCLYGVAQILQTAGLARHPGQHLAASSPACTSWRRRSSRRCILRSRIGVDDLGRRSRWRWPGSGCSPSAASRIGYGEALIFVAAMIYALHIVGLGAWSSPARPSGMAIVQLIVITVICLVCTAPNGLVLPDRTSDWVSVLYMAVFAGAGAMIGQTWAQAHLPPTRAAIIMSMEPVFAALFAVLLGGESADGPDDLRRRPGARRDADRRARAAAQGRGRGHALDRLKGGRGLGSEPDLHLVPRVRSSRALRAHMARTSLRCRRSRDERVWLRSAALRCTHPVHANRSTTSNARH